MKSGNFDPFYIAEVLSDLLSRQYGRSIVIELSKKEDAQKQMLLPEQAEQSGAVVETGSGTEQRRASQCPKRVAQVDFGCR